MPEDVADRLDRVLQQLADRSGEPHEGDPSGVTSLAAMAARRRRRVTSLLVAAAAVVVVGVGVGQVVGVRGSGDAGSAGSSATSAEDAGGVVDRASPSAGDASDQARSAPVPDAAGLDAPMPTLLPSQEPRPVRPERFAADVRRVLRFTTRELAEVAAQGGTANEGTENGSQEGGGGAVPEGTDADGERGGTFADGFACKPAAWGAGLIVPVTYQGQPAVLAFRPPNGDTRVAELLECGTGDLLRSVTLQTS